MDEEPAAVENLGEVALMVQKEFLIWDSFKQIKDTKELYECKEWRLEDGLETLDFDFVEH